MKTYIHFIPVLRSFIGRIEKNILHTSIQTACSKEIKRSGTRLRTIGLTKNVLSTLKDEPVIIVADHPYVIEPIILFGVCPPRKDTYLIINSLFTEYGVNIDKHLIPVYIQHHQSRFSFIQRGSGTFIKKLHKDCNIDAIIEHKKNIHSIKHAVMKVNKGGLVLIFPGKGGENHQWFSGVGHMIKQLTNYEKVKIIMVHIRATSHWDLLRIFPYIGKILPVIKIFFAQPISAKTLYPNSNGKQITKRLEQKFNLWVKKLKKT